MNPAGARLGGPSRLIWLAALAILAVTCAIGAATLFPGDAGARQRCEPLRASGPWGDVRVTVRVQRGRVPCRTARSVARKLFDGKGRHHDGGAGHLSYWNVTVDGRRWRGDARMGDWVMHTCRELEGCSTVIEGTFRGTG